MVGFVVVEKKYYTYNPPKWREMALFREIGEARKWIQRFACINADYRIDEVDITPGYKWKNLLDGGILWIKGDAA